MAAARYSFAIPLIVGCSQFMHQFDGVVIATALPTMARSMNEDPLRLNLAITSYLLALAVFVPISGWLADRFGAKRVYLTAIAVFTASSLMCGLSQSLAALVVSRVVQGIGGAMMIPVGQTIVAKTAPRTDLVKAMSYVSIPAALAPLFGPSVGGFIVTYFDWRWIFFINLPIGVLGLAMVWSKIPDLPPEPRAPLDVRGSILLSAAVIGLVFGFESMGRGLLPAEVVAAVIVGGAICGVLYVLHARRIDNAVVDLSLLRVPTFRFAIAGGALFYVGTTAVVFLLSLMLQLGFGFSAFAAGATTLAGAIGSFSSRFLIRPTLRLFGFRVSLLINGAVTGAYLVICGFFRPSTPFSLILVLLFIGGVARSNQFTAIQSLAYADVPRSRMSGATSFAAMSQQLAQSFGVGLAALVIHLGLVWRGDASPTAADIGPGFFALAVVSIASLFVFFRLPPQAGASLGPGNPRAARAPGAD